MRVIDSLSESGTTGRGLRLIKPVAFGTIGVEFLAPSSARSRSRGPQCDLQT
jgi:hypothetical protein